MRIHSLPVSIWAGQEQWCIYCGRVSFSSEFHLCCVWTQVALFRYHYLPALRSTIITRFVATTADSASVALHLSLMLLGTCALATTFLVGDITDFPVLSTYLYWLADVHNPGWRHSDSVSIEHSEHLLPAMFGNISAPTSFCFTGLLRLLSFRLRTVSLSTLKHFRFLRCSKTRYVVRSTPFHDRTFTCKISQVYPGALQTPG